MASFLEVLVSNAVVAAALAVCGALVWRVRRNAPIAHALLLLALVKLVTPPLFDVGIALPGGGDAAAIEPVGVASGEGLGAVPTDLAALAVLAYGPTDASPVAAADASEAGWLSGIEPASALFVLWMIGALITGVVVLRRARLCARLLARADAAPADVAAQARELSRALGLRRQPDVRVIDARIPPFVFALTGRHTVVLPRTLLSDVSPEDRRAVLAHELSHVANRDHWTRWLEVAVVAVHWWNPIAAWTRRLLDEIAEVRCDARAVDVLASGARSYGRAILRITSRLDFDPAAMPLGASGFGGSDALKRRLTMIAESTLSHRLAWPARCVLLAGAAALLPLGLAAQGKDNDKKKDGEPQVRVRVETGGDVEIDADALRAKIRKALEGVGGGEWKELDAKVRKAVDEALGDLGGEGHDGKRSVRVFRFGDDDEAAGDDDAKESDRSEKSGKRHVFRMKGAPGKGRVFEWKGEPGKRRVFGWKGEPGKDGPFGWKGKPGVFHFGDADVEVMFGDGFPFGEGEAFEFDFGDGEWKEMKGELRDAMRKGRAFSFGPFGKGEFSFELDGDGFGGGGWKGLREKLRKRFGDDVEFEFSFGRDGERDGDAAGKDRPRRLRRLRTEEGRDKRDGEDARGADEIRALRSKIEQLEEQLRALKKRLDRRIV